MRLDDASPALRRAVQHAIDRDRTGAPPRAHRPAPSAPARAETTGAARGGRRSWRCAKCGTVSTAWAAAQRHADTHGGARVEVML